MNILALDTSTKNFSLAVFKNNELMARHNLALDKILSDSIIPVVDSILNKAKMPLSKLDGFAVGLGPGSFTSLRVGLSTVKSFSFATQKPVVGIASLDAIARNVNVLTGEDICVMTDAKRQMVYAAFYNRSPRGLTRKSDYLLMRPGNLFLLVKKDTIFTGDGLEMYRSLLEQHFARGRIKVFCEDGSRWWPQAEQVAALSLARFEQQDYDDSRKIVPLYLYAQDCQVRR